MPSTRPLAPICLALLILLAGCTMPAGLQSERPSGSDEPSVSASPTERVQAALPPGVTESRVVNASALLAGHGDALRETGFRLDVIQGDTGMTYVVEENYSSYRVAPGPTASRPAVWANESVAVARETQDNETVYHRPPRQWPGAARMTGSESLRTLLETSEYTVNGSAPCGDGECTVLRANGSSRFENFSARALVHESGVVYQFHATYAVDGEAREVHLVLAQRGDVTVSRPAWVDTALANT